MEPSSLSDVSDHGSKLLVVWVPPTIQWPRVSRQPQESFVCRELSAVEGPAPLHGVGSVASRSGSENSFVVAYFKQVGGGINKVPNL